MSYDIFQLIPHQRVIMNEASTEEIFDLYQCGLFHAGSVKENIELVELQPHASYRPHYHKNSAAVIYIIAGGGQFQLANDFLEYQPGMRIDIPAGALHGFKTNARTLFLSIQSPPIIDPTSGEIDVHYADGDHYATTP